MEHIGAGLAAIGVIGPGIGIGILGGLAASAIGRNPDATSQIRGLAIILAAFAEGLGLLANVVGLLAHFIAYPESTDGGILAALGGVAQAAGQGFQQEAESGGLTINLFWVIISAVNFIVFAVLAWYLGFKPLSRTLAARRETIEQGLKDADAARRDRESAAEQRAATLAEARREANEIVSRAQRLADETRDQGVAETRTEIERMKEQAVADIDAERLRALADVRGQVADLALAAAGKVVGETMTDQRERRLVDEFLAQVSAEPPSGSARN
ncbi:MAG: F0F1 ATP synthase subunit B [Candidatus Limnocylindrales bacterium]